MRYEKLCLSIFLLLAGCSTATKLTDQEYTSCSHISIEGDQQVLDGKECHNLLRFSCDKDSCFFKLWLESYVGAPKGVDIWVDTCVMLGKTNSASLPTTGTAVAEYRSNLTVTRSAYEQCTLEFAEDEDSDELRITVKEGCDKYCKPEWLGFESRYILGRNPGKALKKSAKK